MDTIDWLSRLLNIVPVIGSLDIRCHYAAPWKIAYEAAEAGVMRYHVVLRGRAVLEHPQGGQPRQLNAGDIVILPGVTPIRSTMEVVQAPSPWSKGPAAPIPSARSSVRTSRST